MTQSPLDAPEGGFDLSAIMQQAQQMQQHLIDTQAELAATEVEGTVGGITVTVNGTGDLIGVRISASAVAGTDDEALTDLADLIVAAYRDARTQSDTLATHAFSPMTNALDIDLGGNPLV